MSYANNPNALRTLPIEIRLPKDTPQPAGDTTAFFSPTGTTDGHISRTVRLIRSSILTISPKITDVSFSLDVVNFVISKRC